MPWHKRLPRLTQKKCYTVYSRNAMVFVPMAKAPLKAGAKLLYNLDLIPEFTSLFSTKVIYAGLPAKAFPWNQAFVDISVFLWLQKQRPSFAQGQPKGYFQLKELQLQRTTKAIAQMNADWKVDKAQYAEFNLPTCGKIAVWQLCRERQPWWNSHDGPELKMRGSMPWCSFARQKLLPKLAQQNCHTAVWIYPWKNAYYSGQHPWKCLDQCCCLSSHGTSSSQGWRKMVVQSKFDPWVYIRVLNTPDLCRFT